MRNTLQIKLTALAAVSAIALAAATPALSADALLSGTISSVDRRENGRRDRVRKT